MAASGLTIIKINLQQSKSASAVLQKSIAMMHTGISLIICCYRYPEAHNPEDMNPGEERQHRAISGSLFQRPHGGFSSPDRNY